LCPNWFAAFEFHKKFALSLAEERLDRSNHIRQSAANAANAEDAEIWRWFAGLVEDRRIRWCLAGGSWLVSVDHRHVATDENFDRAIRAARQRSRLGEEQAKIEPPRRRVA
jgi:hypothetical protein